MKIKAVFFDLDGTLLPMDQELFVKAYLQRMAKKLAPHGYDPETVVAAMWKGTEDVMKNTGGRTNEEVFWQRFCSMLGERIRDDMPIIDEFYRNEFQLVKDSCGFQSRSKGIIELVKERSFIPVLATNPLFPALATESRIRWAGIEPSDFALVTTYENSSFCKPNPEYYREIMAKLGLKAEECVMVGNDVDEDMIAESLGMKVFLLVDCLINRSGKDISHYAHGSFDELEEFLRSL